MNLPIFCYQKAFWVVIGILFTVLFAIIQMDQQINAQQQVQINSNSLILNERNVPIAKSEITYDNVLVLCEKFDATCQRYIP